jgi:hypothetical protein
MAEDGIQRPGLIQIEICVDLFWKRQEREKREG